MAKETNKLTFEQSKLVEENHNLIYGFLSKYNLEYEEWYGICAIGLVKAARAYKPGKGSFSTLAYRCMYNEMLNELRNSNRICRNDDHLLSLDRLYENPKGEEFDLYELISNGFIIEENIIDELYVEELLDFIYSNIKKDYMKKAIDALVNGKNTSEAAEIAGVSRQLINQNIDKIYLKYLDHFKPDYTNRYRKRKG